MNGKKTLYLHIGTPKTGTTSIQNFCYNNIEVLKSKGILYPIMPFKYPGKRSDRNALFLDGALYKEDGTRDKQEEMKRLDRGFKKIEKCFQKYDTLLMSEESLWMTAPNRRSTLWQELREHGEEAGYVVKVIVYLRRQDEYIESWWNQSVKANRLNYNQYDFETFMVKQSQTSCDYKTCLLAIEKELGKENMIVRRFDRREFEDGCIQKDFMNAVGIGWCEDFSLPEESENMNIRLSGNSLFIKLAMNLVPMSFDDHWFVRRVVEAVSQISGKLYPAVSLTKEEAVAYMSRFEEGNRWVEKEFFDDGRPLFHDDYKDGEHWDRNNPYYLDDIVRCAAVGDLTLLHRIESLEKQNGELSKQLAETKEALQHFEEELKRMKEDQKKLKEKLKHPVRTVVGQMKK